MQTAVRVVSYRGVTGIPFGAPVLAPPFIPCRRTVLLDIRLALVGYCSMLGVSIEMCSQLFDRLDFKILHPRVFEDPFGITIVNLVCPPKIGNRAMQLRWHRDQPIKIKRGLAAIVGTADSLTKAGYVLARTGYIKICVTPVWHSQISLCNRVYHQTR